MPTAWRTLADAHETVRRYCNALDEAIVRTYLADTLNRVDVQYYTVLDYERAVLDMLDALEECRPALEDEITDRFEAFEAWKSRIGSQVTGVVPRVRAA